MSPRAIVTENVFTS